MYYKLHLDIFYFVSTSRIHIQWKCKATFFENIETFYKLAIKSIVITQETLSYII